MSRHFSREALRELLQGQGSGEETARAVQHLTECRRCRTTAAEIQGQDKGTGSSPLDAKDARNALALLIEADVGSVVETLKAGSWWAEIRDLSPAEQIRRIRATTSLQSLSVFETILADARVVGRSDPFLGESLVRVAMTVADLLPEPRFSRTLKNDLRGQALTVVANCRRLAAEFHGSTEAIEEASRFLAQGTGDPGAEAGLLSIHCSLCTDFGDFENALVHVRQAVAIFRELEDWKSFAHNMVLEAGCLLAAYRPSEAIEVAHFALERMPSQNLRLRVLAKLIIAESLVILDRSFEALSDFMEAKSLCEEADPVMRLRALHCEARILDGIGAVRESEKLFRSAIKAYFDQELYKQAFLTLLSLFESLCRRGALGKAASLCEEAIAATSQSGEACNEQIRMAWEELLAVVRVRQLSESELIQARQFLVRNWSVPAGAFLLPRVETVAVPAPEPLFEVPPPQPVPTGDEVTADSFWMALEGYERTVIEAALKHTGGNLAETCRLLRISRNTLKERMRRYGVVPAQD